MTSTPAVAQQQSSRRCGVGVSIRRRVSATRSRLRFDSLGVAIGHRTDARLRVNIRIEIRIRIARLTLLVVCFGRRDMQLIEKPVDLRIEKLVETGRTRVVTVGPWYMQRL